MSAQLIALDWGTTNLRAYLLANSAEIMDRLHSGDGIAQLIRADFPKVFSRLLDPWLQKYPKIPVLMSGMVGSVNGWHEVNYLSCPTTFTELAKHLFALSRQIYIVPGLSLNYGDGWCDVMRGEETEIYGAYEENKTLFCVPGTHSKWVEIKNNSITHFTTYMTGEMYHLLKNHSILSKQIQTTARSDEAFIAGLQHVNNHAGFLANFFNIRAQVLHQRLKETDIADYLSGMIIGYELKAARFYWEQIETVTLIADSHLAQCYQLAMQQNQLHIQVISSEDAVTKGLWKIAQQAGLVK